MSTLHVVKDHKIIYTKGALDSILKRANRIEINGEIRVIEETDKRAIMQANKAMSDRALRVLALAKHEYNEQEIEEENLIFIGLVGMVDPAPRSKGCGGKIKESRYRYNYDYRIMSTPHLPLLKNWELPRKPLKR